MRNKTKWYPLETKSKGGTERTFNQNLPKEIKSALGKSLDEQFTETNQALNRNEKQNKSKKNKLNKEVSQKARYGKHWTDSEI